MGSNRLWTALLWGGLCLSSQFPLSLFPHSCLPMTMSPEVSGVVAKHLLLERMSSLSDFTAVLSGFHHVPQTSFPKRQDACLLCRRLLMADSQQIVLKCRISDAYTRHSICFPTNGRTWRDRGSIFRNQGAFTADLQCLPAV